jgi:HSP20 family molecular chaperone IbpA
LDPDESLILKQQGGYLDNSRYEWKLGRLFLTTNRLVFCEPAGGTVFQTFLSRIRRVRVERKGTGLGTKPTLCIEYAGMKSERLIKVWFLLNDLETWKREIHSMTLMEISEEKIGRIVEKLDPPSKKILEYLRLQGHARIDELAELISAPNHMDVLLKIKRNINPTAEWITGNPVLEFVNSKTDELTGERVGFSWWFCGYLMNKKKSKEPLLDIFDEKDSFIVIMETSGVEKDDVVFSVEEDKLIFVSNLVDDKYKAEIPLPPKVNRENFTKRYNNNILELKFKKMKGGEKRWESPVKMNPLNALNVTRQPGGFSNFAQSVEKI